MPIIRSCLSSVNNILKNEKTSYSLIKTEQTGKLLNRNISPANTPAKLLSFRNADLTKEKYITDKVLSIFNIKRNFVAVRVQDNQFTDLKNKTIQGHKGTVAQVIDWYNSRQNAFGITTGIPRRSADIAKEESRNALNFMIMEKDTFNEKILNSDANLQKKYSKTENSSWVVTSIGELLDKGAKVYPDISCSLRLGEPFIITLPESVRLDVDIYPFKK
ncbi:EspJ family T3SS effector ADP-ribosyltransferase [Citrobacter rodentium]|uniref:T3SS effector protein EspJ n=2 Tax=Citrobacter rodentium TaxID=67825 RepID=D2TRY1_CITRI|nr:EspJ family T3SS effector ADP-ribosyltransferase [Citrobacter rodentium]KIQ51388.1 secretion protein EspJ [Citrobacter rodentium]QBY31095.1 EspJ family T3SS effector ADP-ribosyltransferase [Citrobacter rodentium]UHO31536.1 EspJ family T3SS effector ADP-ribosyltransferase [Citrobacter rodentium NBRC 105723 = DSM 16636]CBG91576.1 T3SS effector protein EspJ [Citrobacter rodentium ICC168]HAT8012408.1 secretion protein EspJ [Citrobacter rodentium NBRC 105723 = DSM 16636]